MNEKNTTCVACEHILKDFLSKHGTELPNATDNLENMNVEELLSEFFEKRFDTHERRSSTGLHVSGRFIHAIKKSNKTDISALCTFIEEEYCDFIVGGPPKCIIYMPERHSPNKLKGKIIVEISSGSVASGGDMIFEIQMRKESDFSSNKTGELIRDGWQRNYRYYNISLEQSSAEEFVQLLLFSDLFRQRFLMTTASRVLGSMSTQHLRSASGQIFSFRACVLNE